MQDQNQDQENSNHDYNRDHDADKVNPLLWLYNLKPGDKVIVNYGNRFYYRVAQVAKVKEVKSKKENQKDKILVYIKNGMNNIDIFTNGSKKTGSGKWDLQEVLYEYTDDRYQELILAPSIAGILDRFNFGKLLKSKSGMELLVEIYDKLKNERWLGEK